MGGPGCSIPVREPLSAGHVQDLLRWLDFISEQPDAYPTRDMLESGDVSYTYFGITHTDRLGFASDNEDAEPFSLEIRDNQTEDDIPWTAGFALGSGQ